MPDDNLTSALNELTRAMWDPTAPVPSFWPTGAWGVFLIFASQIGAGIPLGVIRARDAGLSPLATAGLYLVSDFLLAVTVEPLLAFLRWLSRRVAFIGRVGAILARLSGGAGLHDGGVRGPLGLILLSFSVSPQFGRAASEAAGHGFFSGWTLAIIGDMLYFGMLMATTLWVSSIFGDDRLAIGAVLIGTWVLPMVIRRVRRRHSLGARGTPAPAPLRAVTVPAAASTVSMSAPRLPRKSTSHTGRRRPSRGLHR